MEPSGVVIKTSGFEKPKRRTHDLRGAGRAFFRFDRSHGFLVPEARNRYTSRNGRTMDAVLHRICMTTGGSRPSRLAKRDKSLHCSQCLHSRQRTDMIEDQVESKQGRSRVVITIGWIALTITLCVFGAMLLAVDDWRRDFTSTSASLQQGDPDAGLQPLHLTASAAEIASHIQQWSEDQPLWEFHQANRQNGQTQIHLTRTTPICRFVDDIHVTLRGDRNGCRVNAESKSRVGIGDLGQNPRNLKELVSALRNWEPAALGRSEVQAG